MPARSTAILLVFFLSGCVIPATLDSSRMTSTGSTIGGSEPVSPPAFSLSAALLDFGFTPAGTTLVRCVAVSNPSRASLAIQAIEGLGDSTFTTSQFDDALPPDLAPIPAIIAPGYEAQVCFAFTPPENRQYSADARLLTNARPGREGIVHLTGWGGGPLVSCTPRSLGFGQVPQYSSRTRSVTCTNVGTFIPSVGLTLEPVFAGPSAFQSRVAPSMRPPPRAGLQPGESARIDVIYTPDAVGDDDGTLTIKSNAGEDPNPVISLSGQGAAPSPCEFRIVPPTIDFGSVQVGDNSPLRSFEIRNVGNNGCAVNRLRIADDATNSFHILTTSISSDPNNGMIVIPAETSLAVTLDFAPTGRSQALSADVEASVIEPSGDKAVIVALSGISPPPDLTHCLEVPPSADIGVVGWPPDDDGTLCTLASRTFSVANGCQSAVTIQGMSLDTDAPDVLPQFVLGGVPALPFTLLAGSAAEIFEVEFKPTGPGTHTAHLVVSEGAGLSHTIALSGSTVPPGEETDSFVATTATSYVLVGSPHHGASGIAVTLNGTHVPSLAGSSDPSWTYDAGANAIEFTERVDLRASERIDVSYPIGCK